MGLHMRLLGLDWLDHMLGRLFTGVFMEELVPGKHCCFSFCNSFCTRWLCFCSGVSIVTRTGVKTCGCTADDDDGEDDNDWGGAWSASLHFLDAASA